MKVLLLHAHAGRAKEKALVAERPERGSRSCLSSSSWSMSLRSRRTTHALTTHPSMPSL